MYDIDYVKNCVFKIYSADKFIGTGFWVLPNGYFLTCAHIVFDKHSMPKNIVQIIFNDEEFDAYFKKDLSNIEEDIAVYHVPTAISRNIPFLTISEADPLNLKCFAFGYRKGVPYGYSITGNLQVGQRLVDVGETLNFSSTFMPDGASVEGMSGSPLVRDTDRSLVGIFHGQERRGASVCYVLSIRKVLSSFESLLEDNQEASDRRNYDDIERYRREIINDRHNNTVVLSHDEFLSQWNSWSANYSNNMDSKELDDKLQFSQKNGHLEKIWEIFMSQTRWNDAMHHLVTDYKNKIQDLEPHFVDNSQLSTQIDTIDWQENYSLLLTILRRLFNVGTINRHLSSLQSLVRRYQNDTSELSDIAKKSQNILQEIRNNIERPTYGRIINLIGSTGSGKTHFAVDRLSKSSMDGCYFTLYLKATSKTVSLEDYVLEAINKASGISWKNLQQFNNFILNIKVKQADSDCFIESCDSRFIMVFDDIEKWIYLRKEFLEDLKEFISSNTRLHSFFWVLTMTYSSYDTITDIDPFLFEYGYDVSIPLYRYNGYKIPSIGPWIVLDDLNKDVSLGINIIRNIIDQEVALDYVDIHLVEMDAFSQPFLAWVLIALSDTLPIDSLVKLTYVKFIELYIEKKFALLKTNKKMKRLTKEFIKYFVMFLSRTGKFEPLFTEIVNYVTENAINNSELQKRDNSEDAIKKLEELNLVRVDSLDQDLPVELHLRFDVFWEWKIAKQFYSELMESEITKEAFKDQMEGWANIVTTPHRIEGVLEFQLLFFDYELSHSNKLNKKVWIVPIQSKILADAAVWFAGLKASEYIQNYLFTWSKHADEYFENFSKRNTFAYLHFVGELPNSVTSILNKLKILKKHYQLININNLSRYYYYIANKLIEHVEDNEKLLLCLPCFHGCEDLGLAESLAEKCVLILKRNSKENVNIAAKFVIRYLKEHCKDVKSYFIESDGRKSWKRHYFREWILFYFTKFITTKIGIHAYEFLESIDWYRPDRLGFSKPVSIEMEREANISIGFWYRTKPIVYDTDYDNYEEDNQETNEFIMLVKELVRSGEKRKIETAFHLIRHTVPTWGEKTVWVDPEFKPTIEKIYNNPKMEYLVKWFKGFFMLNLKNSEKTEPKL